MQSLRDSFDERDRFLLGVELVITRGTMGDQQECLVSLKGLR